MQKLIQRGLWSPSSYKNFRPYMNYFPDTHPVFQLLNKQQPIVSVASIERTKNHIKNCEENRSAFLHIGDCAQPFEHATNEILHRKISFLKECQAILTDVKKKPAHLIGRIAGQYAKPRSSQFVNINGNQIHNYKGDNVNSTDENNRNPCDRRLLQGYHHSLNTAKFIQEQFPELSTSHEGLIIPYEQSLTRQHEGKFYCCSAHMLWIGERTRQLDGAHIQFFRGLANPIGVKVSSNIQEKQFLNLIRTLNPMNQMGKLLVIVRMGKEKIKSKLPALISMKKNQGLNFLFVTDSMHGNTHQSKPTQLKTRSIDHMLQQIKYFQSKMIDNKLSHGYSFQATFQDVTQCYGLQYPVKQHELRPETFTSKCDPRLNRAQTLKLLRLLQSY